MSATGQLSLDALVELRRVETHFAEAAVDAVARAGLIDHPEPAEDSPSWVGQLMWELDRLNRRASEDIVRLKRLTAKLLHVHVDELEAELAHTESQALHDRKPPRWRPPSPPQKSTTPRIRSAAKALDPEEPAAAPTRKLTDRQRELVALVAVENNVAKYTPTERIPDWPALKVVMLSLGAKWVARKGFVFPDDVDGAEMVRVALESGEVIDWDAAGFFPTPDALADQLVAMLHDDLPEVPHILEPSAGTGSLIRAVKRRWPFAQFYACELIEKNRRLLEKIGGVDLVEHDFMKLTNDGICGEWMHAIVMNPPFGKRADIKHITHALDFLQPGGQLVAIASASVKYRDDELGRSFRDLVAKHNGVIVDNEEGAFKESGTGVRTVRIWMRKEAAEGSSHSPYPAPPSPSRARAS